MFTPSNWQEWQEYQTVTAAADAADTSEQTSIRHYILFSEVFIANDDAGTVFVTLSHAVL